LEVNSKVLAELKTFFAEKGLDKPRSVTDAEKLFGDRLQF